MARVRKDNDQRYVLRSEYTVGGGGNDSRISNGDISNWNEAYSWGDHALAGYMTATGADFYYVQSTQPASPNEGDMWYNTTTEDLLVYRETSTNVFNWIPLSTGAGDSDTLDGGAY